MGVGCGLVLSAWRHALAGSTSGIGVDLVLAVVGRRRGLARCCRHEVRTAGGLACGLLSLGAPVVLRALPGVLRALAVSCWRRCVGWQLAFRLLTFVQVGGSLAPSWRTWLIGVAPWYGGRGVRRLGLLLLLTLLGRVFLSALLLIRGRGLGVHVAAGRAADWWCCGVLRLGLSLLPLCWFVGFLDVAASSLGVHRLHGLRLGCHFLEVPLRSACRTGGDTQVDWRLGHTHLWSKNLRGVSVPSCLAA